MLRTAFSLKKKHSWLLCAYDFLQMEFSGSCEPPNLSTGNHSPDPLQEQQARLTAEPSLQPHDSHLLWAR